MEWEEEEVRRGTCAGSEVAAVPFCPHVHYCICKPNVAGGFTLVICFPPFFADAATAKRASVAPWPV